MEGRTAETVSVGLITWGIPLLKEKAGPPNIMGVVALADSVKSYKGTFFTYNLSIAMKIRIWHNIQKLVETRMLYDPKI